MVVCFELLPQQISHSIKKYIDLCQHAISTNRSCWGPKLDSFMVFWSNVCNLGCKMV